MGWLGTDLSGDEVALNGGLVPYGEKCGGAGEHAVEDDESVGIGDAQAHPGQECLFGPTDRGDQPSERVVIQQLSRSSTTKALERSLNHFMFALHRRGVAPGTTADDSGWRDAKDRRRDNGTHGRVADAELADLDRTSGGKLVAKVDARPEETVDIVVGHGVAGRDVAAGAACVVRRPAVDRLAVHTAVDEPKGHPS